MVRTILPNGLRVLLDPSGAADVAGIYLWVNVGSASEPAGMEGAAHLVEHMVFKGTRSYGVGEVAAAIEDLGGDVNAWTSFDETVFYASAPAAAAPAVVAILAELLTAARFDPDELKRERKVVIEEIRGGEDDPELMLSEAAWAAAFRPHAYGRPIIGTRRAVNAMTHAELVAFYRRHYQPANACLAIAGPIDTRAVEAAVARCLGGGGPAPTGERPPVTPGRGVYRSLRRGFDGCRVQLAWAGPGFGHPDLPALDVLTTALGGGASSPIEARLRLAEGLCLSAGMSYDAQVDAGLAVVHLHAREGRGADAVAAAREEVARAREGGLTRGDIDRARAQILTERVYGRETADGRAVTLAFHRERFGDDGAWRAYDAAILAVDHETLTRVANTWLVDEVGAALIPKSEPWELGPAPTPVPSETVPSPPARAPRPTGPSGLRSIQLDSGLRILLHPDDGEVVSVCAAGIGGALRASPRHGGEGLAWAAALTRGAGRLGVVDYSAAVEALGGAVGAVCGRSSQVVRGDFVGRHFSSGLELYLDLLLAPAFDPAEVDATRQEFAHLLSERDDHPDDWMGDLLWSLAWPNHPWGVPMLGTPRSVGTLTADRLRRRHRAFLGSSGLVVSVVGGFDPDVIERRLRRALGGLQVAPPPPLPGLPKRVPGLRRGSVRAGNEQAHLVIGWPGVSVHDPSQPALDVLAAVLGGQGGRLFREVREDRGLVYEVGASAYDGLLPGLFTCSAVTDPERLGLVETALLECVARIQSEGPGQAEVERARRYLLGGLSHELETASSRASALALSELYGLGAADYLDRPRRRLEAVDHAAVAEAARALGSPIVTARVRPAGARRRARSTTSRASQEATPRPAAEATPRASQEATLPRRSRG